MTKLSDVDVHQLRPYYNCGHNKSIAVADLLDRLVATTTVAQVQAAAKCLGCGERGKVKHMRIVVRQD